MYQLNRQPQTTVLGLISTRLDVWFRGRMTGLHRMRQWHSLLRAAACAYERFASYHPQWAHSLFDMYFLTHTARPLLLRYLTTNPPTPAEFATAWCSQFPRAVPTQDQFAEATRMAAAFLRHLDAELNS